MRRSVYIIVGALFATLASSAVMAQTHFTFTANTSNNATVAIPTSANPGINGTPLDTGDEIGVFTPADLCVGAAIWQVGQNAAITVWGDDEQTTEVDGIQSGQQMHFRVWRQSANIEYKNVNVAYSQGNGIYAVNGIYILSSLTTTETGGNFSVISTKDSGPGSLRETLAAAENHPGPDTVTFNIPTTDPGYNLTTGVWTIKPATGYNVPSGTTVDGTTMTALAGEGSTSRPGIEIDGTTLAQLGITGLRLNAGVTLRGLVVNHFQSGIWIDRANVTIEDCYVGTDPTGTSAKPNGIDGILIANGATGAIIQSNLLSGNNGSGIRLFGDTTTGNTLRNNRVGTDAAGTAALPNGAAGIQLHSGAHGNIVEENLVSGNVGIGIHLREGGTNGNTIRNNRIGTDIGGAVALPNSTFGVALFNGPQHNLVGPGNLIAHNGMDGVLVDGADSFTSTVRNTITANTITANGRWGIYTFRGGNTMIPPPVVLTASGEKITGTANAGETVEIFADKEDEGQVYLGSATADASGNFVLILSNHQPSLPYITATATDADGNTSIFSSPFFITVVEKKPNTQRPKEFHLGQNYPNPFNPTTTIGYQLPVSGFVTLKVHDLLGKEVATLVQGQKAPGWYSVKFEASSLSNGIYFYRLEVSAPELKTGRRFVQTKKLVVAK